MEKIEKYDFVELEYTGKLKDENIVFDTTNKDIAKENSLHSHNSYAPVVICIGENQILLGLDKNLEGKEIGKEYTIEVKPHEAYGNKNPKLIQLIPTNKFRQQNIQPMPGMQVNIDSLIGIIKTVSGGRTLVDFNHPLAGKELVYIVKANRKVTDDKERIVGYLKLSLGINDAKDMDVQIEQDTAKISLNEELPKEAQEELSKKIRELIKNIKNVEFHAKKGSKNK
ncbi:peptidylprolyl isomerase [Candidatus Woesearchaeota archaeon]|nr:peptidylprolyl isomerase [Candidatus Woesearchaeota archaeon]